MADVIQLLPDHVANQIAAGEVVQRPASVVKELLENAIDAEADRIQLIIKDSGKTLVQVIDNGKGMSVTDARLCFERHATSKIRTAEDLFALHTKGFRGEALASIAAVAQVELSSKQEDSELGTLLRIEGSKVLSQTPEVVSKGTSIAVRRLFYNIPARRQFLKSDPVEYRHIVDEFHRVALAHPQVSFRLIHNDVENFNLPVSNLRQRIVNIFGGKTNEKLLPLKEETDLVTIDGFIGKPDYAKRSKSEQYFFVNHRYIRNPYLHHALMAAYEGLIKEGTFPQYFIFLKVDPASIDINIHPTKTEIKFENEQALYAILRASVKHSLGQYSLSPMLDFEKDPTLELSYSETKEKPRMPHIEVDRNFNPFRQEQKSFSGASKKTASWESLYVGIESKSNTKPFDLVEIEDFQEEKTMDLGVETSEQPKAETFQLRRKYILSQLKSGLLLIHQHRAHYRIRYEEILTKMSDTQIASQQIIFPINPAFTHAEISMLSEIKEHLEQAGFQFSKFGFEGLEIQGIPAYLQPEAVEDLLKKVLAALEMELPDSYFSGLDLIAKSIAKSSAVRTGQNLGCDEQAQLLDKLFACKEPQLSPDGKPVYISLDWEDIENKF
ncbi:MAG: DNA mismatch repair endonuclease MutL [Bacteroidetes bacterium]|nr:DNA mismatch repair endonuclease MutL [Bacteroidota bacterium]